MLSLFTSKTSSIQRRKLLAVFPSAKKKIRILLKRANLFSIILSVAKKESLIVSPSFNSIHKRDILLYFNSKTDYLYHLNKDCEVLFCHSGLNMLLFGF